MKLDLKKPLLGSQEPVVKPVCLLYDILDLRSHQSKFLQVGEELNMMKKYMSLLLMASVIVSCTPQAITTEISPTQTDPTQTSIPATATLTSIAAATETSQPTDPPSPTPPTCAVPLNPAEHATVPARGPFDFTWTAFTGATSYIISIGPPDWYPTNFPVNGTTLTRYMENFPVSPSYEWSITAVDATGKELCKAGPFAFVMSVDVAATASFDTGTVAGSNDDNSSNSSDSGSDNNSGNTSNGGSSNQSSSDISVLISSDSDNEQCQLTASFQVKSNRQFVFIRMIYQSNGQDDYVDLTSGPLQPYPSYNYYSATTPSLSVSQGEVVRFGVWYRADTGEESRGLTLQHSMSSCSQ